MQDPSPHGLSTDLDVDDLVRHDRAAPRYTSYPTAPHFSEAFGPAEYAAALENAARRPGEPLSLYVHVPFCHRMCTFCGCTTWVPSGVALPQRYYAALEREVELVASLLGERREFVQLHWGGGTPNFLDDERTRWLMDLVLGSFRRRAGAEVAVEVHPSWMDEARVALYAELGVNRLSMGVQDFAAPVQRAIGREQSFADTRRVIDSAREKGMRGINVDLVYGLPHQTPDSIEATLDRVLELRPDRVAAYSFGFMPQIKGHQSAIDPAWLPEGRDKWALFARIHDRLLQAGYRPIGMDHFALPDDELALAQHDGRLHRNFQGYTVLATSDVVGLGISAIGDVDGCYAQNAKSFRGYCEALEAGGLATARGLRRSLDDELRRAAIESLMCNLRIDWAALSERFELDVRERLADVVEAATRGPEADFIRDDGHRLELTERGRPFVRNVAMRFDAYQGERSVGSRSI